jgi:vancomycin permeability regulator SanA
MAIIGHLFAYQQNDDGTLVPQSAARCLAAAIAYHNGRMNRIAITADISRGGTSIADAMKQWLVEHDVDPRDVVINHFGSANTTTEIEAALLFCIGPDDQVVAISSWYHLPRIWWLYRVRGIRARLVPAWGGTSLMDIILEPLKLLNNVFRPYDWKFITAAP